MNDLPLKQAFMISTGTILDSFLETVCAHMGLMNHNCEIKTLDTDNFLQEGEIIAYAKGLIVNGRTIGYYWITHDTEPTDTHDILFSGTEFHKGVYDSSSQSVKPSMPMALDFVRVYEKPEDLSPDMRRNVEIIRNTFPENRGITMNKAFSEFTDIRNIVRATSDAIRHYSDIDADLYMR